MKALKRAVAFFESEGIVRNLIMEGEPVMELLELLLEEIQGAPDPKPAGFTRGFINKVLLAIQVEKESNQKQTIGDMLSNRELDVLRLIAAGFSNQEVADRLFISLNTVRTHTKNIHSKLDVHSRTQAIARAKEKGLI